MAELPGKRKSHLMLERFQDDISLSTPDEFTSQPRKGTEIAENDRKTSTRPQKIQKKSIFSEISGGVPHELKLVKAVKAGVPVQDFLEVKRESLWTCFEPVYELKLDEMMTVAFRKSRAENLVLVKAFSGSKSKDKIEMLRQIRHPGFLRCQECFDFEDVFYGVFEYVSLCLSHLVTCPAYPTESHLAAILGQILEGIAYLASRGLRHGYLQCSNILVARDGKVKIVSYEQSSQASVDADIKAIGYVAMELMQKYKKDDGAVGVEDLKRWPSDSNAVSFLSMTTSEPSIPDLQRHALLASRWRKEDLAWLVGLAEVSAYRSYKYEG